MAALNFDVCYCGTHAGTDTGTHIVTDIGTHIGTRLL